MTRVEGKSQYQEARAGSPRLKSGTASEQQPVSQMH